ncbi:hypothetical protein ACFCXK_24270 [Streptomyces sp. NPDC056269]|uniref:hypothetical protein n=1 Tax=Streptomyces sp. NPDC056269 TaxID=3345768 RepID=UPI0035D76EDD
MLDSQGCVRRPAVAAAKTADVRTSYLESRSIAALARDHRVSRGAIRTAVADLLPDRSRYAAGDHGRSAAGWAPRGTIDR